MEVIRLPRESEGDKIISIAQDAGVFNSAEVETVKEVWKEYLKNEEIEYAYHFLVIGEKDQIHGFACYGQRPLTQGTFDLYWIVINSDQRRKGFGKAILQRVEQDVLTKGGRLLIIETSGSVEYDPTRAFYLSSGYQLEAKICDFYHPRDDLMIFTKHLVN